MQMQSNSNVVLVTQDFAGAIVFLGSSGSPLVWVSNLEPPEALR